MADRKAQLLAIHARFVHVHGQSGENAAKLALAALSSGVTRIELLTDELARELIQGLNGGAP